MQITRHFLLQVAAKLALAFAAITPALGATAVHVPFNFVAAGKSYPAGTYSVGSANTGNLMYISSQHGEINWISLPASQDARGRQAILRFDQVGQTYLLRTVQYGMQITPRLDKRAKQLETAEEQTIVSDQTIVSGQ